MELLVVMAIIGILTSLLAPAVQQIREAARRTTCSNQLKQLALGLHQFESSNRRFPAGAELETAHSWASRILPFIEEGNIYDQLDFSSAWNSDGNLPWVKKNIESFLCPTSWKDWDGATDYCGISGSYINAKKGSRNGILFPAASDGGVRTAEITDGLSSTIAIAEGVAVTEVNNGYWASGIHCFTHDDGGVNNRQGGLKEIASLHPSGAQSAFCDGSVQFLTTQIAGEVIGALCTRNNSEVINETF